MGSPRRPPGRRPGRAPVSCGQPHAVSLFLVSTPVAHELTFLFTDIEGSTRLLRRLGPAYAEVLEQHRDLIASAIAEHDGEIVDRRGDEFFAAFAESEHAVS